MRPYLRLFLCLPLLATTACVADAIAGPELTPEPEPGAIAQAGPEPPSILVRLWCTRSISPRPTEPMYIVDGVVVLSLAGLDNDDVVSIEVLEGNTAAALYGTRAARGVIIISTRSGASLRG